MGLKLTICFGVKALLGVSQRTTSGPGAINGVVGAESARCPIAVDLRNDMSLSKPRPGKVRTLNGRSNTHSLFRSDYMPAGSVDFDNAVAVVAPVTSCCCSRNERLTGGDGTS